MEKSKMEKMKFDFEISENDIIKRKPTKSGWYLCKKRTSSIGCRSDGFHIATYEPRLLYWENNVWLTHPSSYGVVEDYKVLEWVELPKGYGFTELTLKINYESEAEQMGE